jgi:hypothetical protein
MWIKENFGDMVLLKEQIIGGAGGTGPMSTSERANLNLLVDPDDIPFLVDRDLLRNYESDFLPCNWYDSCLSPPLPVRVVSVKNSSAIHFVVTERGRRVFAQAQPHHASVFGIDVNHYPSVGLALVRSLVESGEKPVTEEVTVLNEVRPESLSHVDLDVPWALSVEKIVQNHQVMSNIICPVNQTCLIETDNTKMDIRRR